jgi:hypothetical protein
MVNRLDRSVEIDTFISARWSTIDAALRDHLPELVEARVAAFSVLDQFSKSIAVDTTVSAVYE